MLVIMLASTWLVLNIKQRYCENNYNAVMCAYSEEEDDISLN